MTGILYWNIGKFGLNKIANPGTDTQKGSTKSRAEASANRCTIILSHLTDNLE
jgi:hypothetical protein